MALWSGFPHRLNVGGLLVAAVGYGLTRYSVIESLRPDASLVGFLLSDAPVLVAGFGLTAFGFGLAMSSRDSAEAAVVARWCLLGTGAMAAVIGLTYAAVWPVAPSTTEARLIANGLVGGAVGGTLTGVWSVRARRHRRDVSRQADRLTVLNRLLRHEVLNKVNVIEGYASVGGGQADGGRPAEPWDVVRRHADAIDDTIDVVGMLTAGEDPYPVDLREHVERAVESVRRTHPSATVELDAVPAVEVCGSAHLHVLFEHLIENAVVHDDRPTSTVRVSVDAADPTRSVRVRIVDDGPGLPPAQQRLVRDQVTPEEDDPQSGFGLALARLMLDDVDGDLTVETPVADGRGTALTVGLRREDPAEWHTGVTPDRLRRGAAAGLVAGGAMGLLTQFITGRIGIIGALYGVENAGVGWVTHQFHSVFFALLFVTATVPWVRADDWRTTTALGVGYGAALWLVAAGIVMPLWLRMVGIPAPVPNLRFPSLANHLLWGAVFGGVYAWLRRRRWLLAADDG
ncbi:sensor histidine kinase [Haloplanus pelagicus]|jgi:signal transduction histidine kinase|uniref:ATP-binding protein n=1 Tax=Haloplanus pelagicus TaxID=2949995 RepID=UPI00203AD0BB|nr:HAMP domain-containing sensor histidine kinase [Haloplanus sp. HW8-1]